VAVVVLGSNLGGGHWANDRATLTRHMESIQAADARNDTAALSRALQTLVDECERLAGSNGEAANTGKDFDEAQRICATAGVDLY
jgi:hypothetical protein